MLQKFKQMKMILLYILAFTGGVFLAVQAGFNTQLGTYLKNPLSAVFISSIFRVFFTTTLFMFVVKEIPTLNVVRDIPWYLWFIGSLFSVIGISLYFYTIPQLGISKMITLGLAGQLIFSVVIGRLGWFNLPSEPISITKMAGLGALLLGIILINKQ